MVNGKWAALGAMLLGAVAGCNSDSQGPGNGGVTPVDARIVVLNSLSKTVQQFNLDGNTLIPFGATIQLPANFDGVAMDVVGNALVTTISALNGSQVVWADLTAGEVIATSSFPGAGGALADPGRPTMIVDAGGSIAALIPARGQNSVHIAFPGLATTSLIAADVGEFVERVLPFGVFLVSMDANLDDGGDFSPLGPPRMQLNRFNDGSFVDAIDIPGSVGFTDAAILQDNLVALAGGGFTPEFLPAGDGSVVVINVTDRGVRDNEPIEGNGLSMEPGKDGLAYITRTRGAGTFDTDVLTFSFFTEAFDRGPSNPIRPLDEDGSEIRNCRVVTALIDRRMLCATFEAALQGRLILLDQAGAFLDETPIGAGATDIFVR